MLFWYRKIPEIDTIHEKNDFVEVSKNSAKYRPIKQFSRSKHRTLQQYCNNFATFLQYTYLECDPTKLFLDLYLAKPPDIPAKSFFPCMIDEIRRALYVDFSLCRINIDTIYFRVWKACKSGELTDEFEFRITNLMRWDTAICNSRVFARSNEI